MMYTTENGDPKVGKIIAHFFLAIIALIVVFGSFRIIGPQDKGIVVRLGSINRTLESGLNFKIPLLEKVVKIDVSTNALPVDELAYSKDGQIIQFQATINYAVDSAFVVPVYKEYKKEYEARVVIPQTKEAIKSVASNYTAQGIIDNRSKLPAEMQAALATGIQAKGFTLSDIAITNIDFDDDYEKAITNKQVQEQQALAQVNITKQEVEKKEQEILKAAALAEKTRLEAVALQSAQGEKLIDKLYAEAALEAAKKWNGVLPTQMIPGSTVPFINLSK